MGEGVGLAECEKCHKKGNAGILAYWNAGIKDNAGITNNGGIEKGRIE